MLKPFRSALRRKIRGWLGILSQEDKLEEFLFDVRAPHDLDLIWQFYADPEQMSRSLRDHLFHEEIHTRAAASIRRMNWSAEAVVQEIRLRLEQPSIESVFGYHDDPAASKAVLILALGSLRDLVQGETRAESEELVRTWKNANWGYVRASALEAEQRLLPLAA